MANSIKLCGVIQMFGVDSFSHKVYSGSVADYCLFLKKKRHLSNFWGHALVSAKTRAVPTGESKFRAKTDVVNNFLFAAVM